MCIGPYSWNSVRFSAWGQHQCEFFSQRAPPPVGEKGSHAGVPHCISRGVSSLWICVRVYTKEGSWKPLLCAHGRRAFFLANTRMSPYCILDDEGTKTCRTYKFSRSNALICRVFALKSKSSVRLFVTLWEYGLCTEWVLVKTNVTQKQFTWGKFNLLI